SAQRAADGPRARVEIVRRLAEAEARLAEAAFDVALIDFGLIRGGGKGAARMGVMLAALPVVLLIEAGEGPGAIEAVRHGVPHSRVRGHMTPLLLGRGLRCAIERARPPLDLSPVDPLTGLYNRRGFELLAEAQLKWMRRSRSHVVTLYADVDGLKAIN